VPRAGGPSFEVYSYSMDPSRRRESPISRPSDLPGSYLGIKIHKRRWIPKTKIGERLGTTTVEQRKLEEKQRKEERC